MIDKDHRDLVPLVNVFLASIRKGVGKHSLYDDVDEISVKFSAHFERENQLMAESRYPDTQAHLAEHAALLADLGKFLQAVDDATDDEAVYLVSGGQVYDKPYGPSRAFSEAVESL